jgi:hypothetical protein
MHKEPIPVAFVVAAGASAILAPPVHGADFAVIVIGSTLTAATTGIIAAAMQFLPKRWFNVCTVLASVVTWMLVSRLLSTFGHLWQIPIAGRVGIAWAVGSATALILSRASGMQLPRLRRWTRRVAPARYSGRR